MHLERLILGFAFGLIVLGANAAVYKWVDDKGVVQYSDKPPASKSKGGVQMSNRGVVVKKLDTDLTPEQQKAKDEEDARRKAEEQQAIVQRRADHALLQSFTSAQEIDVKRDRELQAIDATITNLRGQERSVSERLNDDKKRAEAYAKRSNPALTTVKDDIARSEAELKVIRQDIERRQQEIGTTRSKYDSLKKRYLELRQDKSAATGSPSAAAPPPSGKK